MACGQPFCVCVRCLSQIGKLDNGVDVACLSAEVGKVSIELEKPGYVDKVPAHLVERDKAQLAELNDRLEKVKGQLAKLA